jgi:hypothetical protein
MKKMPSNMRGHFSFDLMIRRPGRHGALLRFSPVVLRPRLSAGVPLFDDEVDIFNSLSSLIVINGDSDVTHVL